MVAGYRALLRAFYRRPLRYYHAAARIDNPALRPVIEKHRRFFSSKERIERFKALGIAEYSERSIEIGIMAVLTKQRAADVNAIFKALLSEDIIDDVAKVVGIELIHKYARSDYGYSLPEFDLKGFDHAVPLSLCPSSAS